MTYQTPLILTENTSNNALNFERRENPSLYVPAVIEGGLDDVRMGNEVVFEDFDEYDQLQSCVGLEHLVKLKHPQTGKPMVVVDNHNHVFYFWYEAWHQGLIERGITLVHIDAHRDTRVPQRSLTHEEAGDLKAVFQYTNSVLNVGNYIPPSREEGLVGELISITSERELDEFGFRRDARFCVSTKNPFILNIDLDFWAPEMDYIPRQKSLSLVKKWMEQADLVTFATSPFFIEQTRAIEVLHALFE